LMTWWGWAGQPKTACYAEGIMLSTHSDVWHGIHFGHGRDGQFILITLSSSWCGCIYIGRMISFATTLVCKGLPSVTNSNIICPQNPENQPSSNGGWCNGDTWPEAG
jgi:hypothetical protein